MKKFMLMLGLVGVAVVSAGCADRVVVRRPEAQVVVVRPAVVAPVVVTRPAVVVRPVAPVVVVRPAPVVVVRPVVPVVVVRPAVVVRRPVLVIP